MPRKKGSAWETRGIPGSRRKQPDNAAPALPRNISARPLQVPPMVNIKGDRAAAEGAYTPDDGEEETAPA